MHSPDPVHRGRFHSAQITRPSAAVDQQLPTVPPPPPTVQDGLEYLEQGGPYEFRWARFVGFGVVLICVIFASMALLYRIAAQRNDTVLIVVVLVGGFTSMLALLVYLILEILRIGRGGR